MHIRRKSMKNEKYCILAGGCFWCASKPYYEYEGIKKVYSGYSGGDEINPTYEQVKKQQTKHMESIKIIYAFLLGIIINIFYEKNKNIFQHILGFVVFVICTNKLWWR